MKGHKAHHSHHAHGGHIHHMVKKHSMHALKHRSHHAKGGHVEHGHEVHDETPSDVYAGGNSPTVKEAEAKGATRKRGGRAMHKGHHAHGGHAKHVEMHGHHAHHRLDRPKRKSGGKVGGGSEMHPFSAAHNVKTPAGRDVDAGES